MNNENIDNLNKLIIINDKNKDGFISLKEFISSEKSLGPREIPKGLFKHYAQGTLSYHFINLLIKTNHPIISKIVCLPNLNYCIYSKLGTNFNSTSKDLVVRVKWDTLLNTLEKNKLNISLKRWLEFQFDNRSFILEN